jgi:chromosomal replication initiation ATPase DnaA
MRSGDVTDPLVLSGEALARDVARAVRASEMPKLMAEWAQRDMVLLDEAHRLRGQRRAQAETVNLMHSVLQRGGRVLVLSRHPPQEIHGLDERLSSHLLAGMLVRLGEPDPSDRCAVLEAVGAGVAVPIEPGVAAALAQRCPGTLTDAVTLLGRLAAEAAASGGKLTLAETVARLARAQPGGAGMDALLNQVARAMGVPITRIRSSDKSREVARARHVVVYLATNSLGMSARQICRHLGLRSPSVAAYARRQVDRRRRLDSGFDQIVLGLQAHLDGAQRDLAW